MTYPALCMKKAIVFINSCYEGNIINAPDNLLIQEATTVAAKTLWKGQWSISNSYGLFGPKSMRYFWRVSPNLVYTTYKS